MIEVERVMCKCGHPDYVHSDIASYRMTQDKTHFKWCNGEGCTCLNSFDDVTKDKHRQME